MEPSEYNKRCSDAVDAEQVIFDLLYKHFPDAFMEWSDRGGDPAYDQEDSLGPLAEILSELPFGDPHTGEVWAAMVRAIPVMMGYGYPEMSLPTLDADVERALRLGAEMVSAEYADTHEIEDEDYTVEAVYDTLCERFRAESDCPSDAA